MTAGGTERAGTITEDVLTRQARKPRMLVIANPYATTVSARLKNLVVYALGARYEVEVVETEAPDHATALCREAAAAGVEIVVAFGGDGTVNEAANGLVGSDTVMTCLPGGATNVFCRVLGIPHDVVDATEHLLALADAFHPRRVDLGRVGPRHFVFSSGVGLDANVVERVDRRPRLKARLGEWFYAAAALSTFSRRYLVDPPRVRLELPDESVEAVTVIVQNADPFTFFGDRPIRLSEGAGLRTGTLALTALQRSSALALPTLLPRLLSTRAGTVQGHRRIQGFPQVAEARIVSVDDRPFPVQVDGDFIGTFDAVDYCVVPDGLLVVA